jgi:hypothetical protein
MQSARSELARSMQSVRSALARSMQSVRSALAHSELGYLFLRYPRDLNSMHFGQLVLSEFGLEWDC